MEDDELQRIYQWVDEVPLTRPKRNIARDFSDGVLTAEIVAHYFPKLVELHNFPAANSYKQKAYNWQTLNSRVFKKMGFQLQQEEMDALCNCQPQAVEKMLKSLQQRMAKYGAKRAAAEAEASPPPYGGGAVAPSGGGPSGVGPSGVAASGGGRPVRTGAAGAAAGAASAVPTGAGRLAMAEGRLGERLGQMNVADGGVQELLAEKDHNIKELRETVDILEIKIQKLEQLVRLKDSKIATLQAKLQQAEPR